MNGQLHLTKVNKYSDDYAIVRLLLCHESIG